MATHEHEHEHGESGREHRVGEAGQASEWDARYRERDEALPRW